MGKEEKGFWHSLGWPEWIAMAAVAIVVAGTAAILSPGFRAFVSNSATAAWVQAIGSIGAIVAAIILGRNQYTTGLHLQEAQGQRERQKQQEAEHVEVERILQAIRDEIEVRWAQFEEVIGVELDACIKEERRMFDAFNLMPAEPFPVYHSLIGRLPLIEDTDLRKRIVRCYARMEGLVLTVEMNSELAKNYLGSTVADEISRINSTAIPRAAAQAMLKRYFPTLVGSRAAAKIEVEALLPLLSR